MPTLVFDEMFPDRKKMSAQKRRHLERRMPVDMSTSDTEIGQPVDARPATTRTGNKKPDWENRKIDRRNMPVRFT